MVDCLGISIHIINCYLPSTILNSIVIEHSAKSGIVRNNVAIIVLVLPRASPQPWVYMSRGADCENFMPGVLTSFAVLNTSPVDVDAYASHIG